jgi:hypothetical protein
MSANRPPSFADLIAATLAGLRRLHDRTTSWLEQLGYDVAQPEDFANALRDVLRRWQEAWVELLPPNWRELEADEVFQLIEIIQSHGFSLAWAPRPAILKELLASDPAKRHEVVRVRRDEIVADLLLVLDEVSHGDLGETKAGVRAALTVARQGNGEAAEALATVIFTSLMHEHLKYGRHAAAKEDFEDEHPEDADILEFRLRAVFLAAAHALRRFDPKTRRPPYRRYNRHSSIHAFTRTQYNEIASVSSLMLVTSLLREIDWWLSEHGEIPLGPKSLPRNR